MRCFVLLTLVGGLSGAPTVGDESKSYVNRDLAFVVIPIRPDPKSELGSARAALTTTRGVFYVKETRDEVMRAPCYVGTSGDRPGSSPD